MKPWQVLLCVIVTLLVLSVGLATYQELIRNPCELRDICDHYDTVTGWSTDGHAVFTTVCTRSHVGTLPGCVVSR